MIGCWHHIILIYISSSYAVDQYFFISQLNICCNIFSFLFHVLLRTVPHKGTDKCHSCPCMQGNCRICYFPIGVEKIKSSAIIWDYSSAIISDYSSPIISDYSSAVISDYSSAIISDYSSAIISDYLFISYNIRIFIHQL